MVQMVFLLILAGNSVIIEANKNLDRMNEKGKQKKKSGKPRRKKVVKKKKRPKPAEPVKEDNDINNTDNSINLLIDNTNSVDDTDLRVPARIVAGIVNITVPPGATARFKYVPNVEGSYNTSLLSLFIIIYEFSGELVPDIKLRLCILHITLTLTLILTCPSHNHDPNIVLSLSVT